MTALPNTRDALGESWTSTSRRACRIARHSRYAAEDIAGELRTLMSELESTLADGTHADAVALRGRLRKQLDSARARLNDTREAVRERANVALADADDYVHENPWQTLAIVGGVALIAGALFDSRMR
ncbi:MAG: ElaB protein [uncultured Paraburkholderia sp.]|nr:MAG: ElaB protein [uncultured Paraburkholderia sp.]